MRLDSKTVEDILIRRASKGKLAGAADCWSNEQVNINGYIWETGKALCFTKRGK